MHQREGGGRAQVAQVEIIGRHLMRHQQALVNNGAARQAVDVKIAFLLQAQFHNGVLNAAADEVQFALESVFIGNVRAAPDKNLPDDRFDRSGQSADFGVIDRHVAPGENGLPFFPYNLLENLLIRGAFVVFGGQKQHAHAVLAGGRQSDALSLQFIGKKLMRNLKQDARAVARIRVAAGRAPMFQFAQHVQALLDDGVGFMAFDMRDEADAAGVVFKLRVVQSMRGGQLAGFGLFHWRRFRSRPAGCRVMDTACRKQKQRERAGWKSGRARGLQAVSGVCGRA